MMATTLRPRGHTVLVELDPAPETTSGGISLPDDHDHVPTSGHVIAVGDGSARDSAVRKAAYKRVLTALREYIDAVAGVDEFLQQVQHWIDTPEPTLGLTRGARVVFPREAGLLIDIGRTHYLLIEEDAVAVVLEDEAESLEASA